MNIHKLLVVGSGIMGRGIAYVATVGGYRVFINDISTEALSIV